MDYTLDNDTKTIVRAIVHADTKRKKRKYSGEYTEFDIRAEKAIAAARRETRLDGYAKETREYVLKKIYESLLYNIPWELLGETYCCRRLFYDYRKEYCYHIAVHMGLIGGRKGSSQLYEIT